MIILFIAWVVSKFLRIKKSATDIEQIISDATFLQDVPKVDLQPKVENSKTKVLRERLIDMIDVAVAGKSKGYLGKNITFG